MPADTAPLRPRTFAIDWDAALAAVLAEPHRVRPAFQPIFDLRNGAVAGFEMLARFDAPANASPPEWLAAAEGRGLGARLEALLLGAGLRARQVLPPACFLAVNLSPLALLSSEVAEVLGGRDLGGLVIEMIKSAPAEDFGRLEAALERLRTQGAEVAVDDAGAGYASLRHVLRLRPSFVKLDRALIAGIDRDPAKFALVEAMGSLASRLDAWIVAEGVERPQEREALAALGIPLAQGFGLARPAPELQAGLRLPAAAPRGDGVLALVRRDAATVAANRVGGLLDAPHGLPGADAAVVLDDDDRPVGLLVREHGGWRLANRPLAAQEGNDLAAIARQAMARPRIERFDPIACCDETGRHLGLVALEDLVSALSELAA